MPMETFVDRNRKVVNKGFRYYTDPSPWDDDRNKLVLLGMLSPAVTVDVIKSLIDRAKQRDSCPPFSTPTTRLRILREHTYEE